MLLILRCFCKIAKKKGAVGTLSSVVSVPTEQLGFQWMDFHEILYLSFFQKSVKIQVLLKSDRNSGYFM